MSRRNEPANDNISRNLEDKVPDHLEGNDKFVDIINWNIKFFSAKNRLQAENVKRIMQELNADIFVLQEIEPGSLEPVAEFLNDIGAGAYKAAYGTTGGDQLVAFLYDTEWVKAARNFEELFAGKNLRASDGKEVFPRLPLHTIFSAKTSSEPLDFHLVGVHLKSKRGGGTPQREAAAKHLAQWFVESTTDEDVIILGDWNNTVEAADWKPFHELENSSKAVFSAWNVGNEASHLSKSGRSSRIDLVLTSPAMRKASSTEKATVIRWSDFSKDSAYLSRMIDTVSDHLPVLTRFYFIDEDS